LFGETLIDPIKTVKRDLLPRFKTSKYFLEMERRISELNPLPTASMLNAPYPTSLHVSDLFLAESPESPSFEIVDFLSDRILYEIYLGYLEANVCSENLLFIRMVHVYKEIYKKGNKEEISNCAWDIFKFFIAERSAFEIGCSHRRRQGVMYSLANPLVDTFDFIETHVMRELAPNFKLFKASSSFRDIPNSIRKRISELRKKGDSKQGAIPCLGVSN
jgi:hypothetical protein